MSIDLEYAIKQDIRNNPVVREVDVEQKREFIRMLAWAAVMFIMLMIALLPKITTVSTNYRVEDLRDDLAREDAYYRQYRLEKEQLLRPQLLEHRAKVELGLVEPTEKDTLVIERVPASPPASRAIVAANR
jgi:esterase/lipase superfamily enzyme